MLSARTVGVQGTSTHTHTCVDKYPVEPGEVPWNMQPSLSVELSFKMMEHSIESLQEWYQQTAADTHLTTEEKKNLPKPQAAICTYDWLVFVSM